MTVSSTLRKAGPFNGNGVTTAFPFAFKVFAKGDVQVTHEDAAGVQTVLVLDSDYSVTLNADQDNNPGGSITYPLAGSPLPNGHRLIGIGSLTYDQATDITNLGKFLPQVHENVFDRIVILAQQLFEKVTRAISVPVGDTATLLTLPNATNRAGKAFVFDNNGNAGVGDNNFAALASSAASSAASAAASKASAADSAAAAGAVVLGNFLQAGAGAQPRTFMDKVREWFSAVDFGADKTGAVDAAPTLATLGATPTLLPTGTYKLNSDVAGLGKMFFSLGGVKFTGVGRIQTSTAYGVGALASNVGFDTGNPTLTDKNTGIGTRALYSNTTGYQNTAVGDEALYSNTTGSQNTALGLNVLYYCTTGQNNTGVGVSALRNLTTGSQNTAVGRSCGFALTTSVWNTLMGRDTGWQKTVGDSDTGVGSEIWWDLTAGSTGNNTALGWRAMYHWTGGAQNTVIGNEAGYANGATTTYSGCTLMGHRAAFNNSSSNMTAVGWEALYNNTTGLRNTAVGYNAASAVVTGNDVTAIGWQAALSVTGSGATVVGSGAGAGSGSDNVVIGRNAGTGLTTGGNNTLVGTAAGQNLTVGIGNTVIGYNVPVPAAGNNNQIVIGSGGAARLTFDNTRWLSAGDLSYSADNLYSLGTPSNRSAVVYSATASINTSDARTKQQVRELSAVEHAVAVRVKALLRAFKFNDAVERKGDAARWHFGVVAQDVQAAFAAEGLNADDYGLFCHDTWEELPEERDADGNVTRAYRPAGDRYGVRYEELLAFVLAAL